MRKLLTRSALLLAAAAVLASWLVWPSRASADGPAAQPQQLWVYIGTFTSGKSRGIYLSHLDLHTGQLAEPTLAAEVPNPSFLALHPNRRWLYAVGRSAGKAKPNGAVFALAIHRASGQLRPLNQQPSGGDGPCHLVVDRRGKHVLVANYSSGSVACLPIGSDGRLAPATAVVQHVGHSVNPRRQKGPHAHSINLDAANRFAFAADLGLDKVLIYRFDASRGTLTPNDPSWVAVEPGSGPRHFAFHPNGRFAYVINEMASTVTAMAYDADRGALEPLQTITTLPKGFEGDNTTAEVQLHPSGKFLYGSNRGHDSIAVYAVDADTGRLALLGHQSTEGSTPRNFAIDPTGRFLLAANQRSETVVVLRIDPASGRLSATGRRIEVPAPVCIKMMAPPG